MPSESIFILSTLGIRVYLIFYQSVVSIAVKEQNVSFVIREKTVISMGVRVRSDKIDFSYQFEDRLEGMNEQKMKW